MGTVRDQVDRLDQLVHAAAKAVSGPLLEIEPAELERAIAVNGLALVNLVREALPMMGEGSTVFYVSSRGARFVIPNYGALGTAKALGEHIVRYLAREVAPRGVRVLTVAPGAVDTAAFRAMFPDTWEERLAAAAAANPMGRGGHRRGLRGAGRDARRPGADDGPGPDDHRRRGLLTVSAPSAL